MALGPTRLGAFTALIPVLPMFFSTWETYHTHTLYLGYFNGPTEGLIIACSIMILSGYYGPEIWSTPLHKYVGFQVQLGEASVREYWVAILLGSFFTAHLPACVVNVARARREKNLPLAPVFAEWTPMIVFVGALTAWLGSPNTYLLKDNHLCLLCLTLSFVFGRMTTKIILAHLTRQPFPYWTMMLAPLVGGAVLANLHIFGLAPVSASTELWYLRAYFVYALVVYFRWAIIVINAICGYLGINCLTIPEEKWSELKREKEMNGDARMEGSKVGMGELKVKKDVGNGRKIA